MRKASLLVMDGVEIDHIFTFYIFFLSLIRSLSRSKNGKNKPNFFSLKNE